MSRTHLEPRPIGRPGCLCPPDLASAAGLGECIVAGDGAGGILIVRADPRIAVSGMLLLGWHDMTPPGFSLECRSGTGHIGDVIRAEAEDSRAVYVVTRLVTPGEPPWGNLIWEASWPD